MHFRTPSLLLAVALGICGGAFTVAHLLSGDTATGVPTAVSAPVLAERLARGDAGELDPRQTALVVESLVRLLDEEIGERRVLEEQVAALRAELTVLQQMLGRSPATGPSAGSGFATAAESSRSREQSIEDRLSAAGFTPQQLEAVRRLEAAEQMKWIEIDDRARREGWFNTPRYFDEINNASTGGDSVRQNLGDERYDRYLYASGRPNRITVQNVIPTSQAEKAGLQQGDMITHYGGARVFSPQQLTRLRSTGDSGIPVTVDVIRNGQHMQITLRRGPIGIQTAPHLVDPSSSGG